jgi:Fe-Mn family superoxide dismutase
MPSRREMLRLTIGSATAVGWPATIAGVAGSGRTLAADRLATDRLVATGGAFTLGALPYASDALEPSIDAETMTIHHTKHHQAYVNNLNAALEQGAPDLFQKSVAEIISNLDAVPEAIRTAVRNNGGGHWNHTFFWSVMAPPGKGGALAGGLLRAIEASFGSLEGFRKEFAAAAAARFGSGWAWLVPGKEKPLAVVSTPNQDNPLMDGGAAPLLGLDVWEHAYYLKYRNLRPAYVEAWWDVVDWNAVAANFAAAAT